MKKHLAGVLLRRVAAQLVERRMSTLDIRLTVNGESGRRDGRAAH